MLYSFRNPEDTETHSVPEELIEHYELIGWTQLATAGETGPDPEAEIVEGMWVVPLEVVKARKWEAIKAVRDVKRYSGCPTPLGVMDNDGESQRKVTSAVAMAGLIGETFSIPWTMKDNTVITHDKAAIEAAGLAMGMYDAECHAVGQGARTAMEGMTREQIEALDPEALPWPS